MMTKAGSVNDKVNKTPLLSPDRRKGNKHFLPSAFIIFHALVSVSGLCGQRCGHMSQEEAEEDRSGVELRLLLLSLLALEIQAQRVIGFIFC